MKSRVVRGGRWGIPAVHPWDPRAEPANPDEERAVLKYTILNRVGTSSLFEMKEVGAVLFSAQHDDGGIKFAPTSHP